MDQFTLTLNRTEIIALIKWWKKELFYRNTIELNVKAIEQAESRINELKTLLNMGYRHADTNAM